MKMMMYYESMKFTYETYDIGGFIQKSGNIIKIDDHVFRQAYCGAVFGRPVRVIHMSVVSNASTPHPQVWATVEDICGHRDVCMDLDTLGMKETDSVFIDLASSES